jgi:hypothetical protein
VGGVGAADGVRFAAGGEALGGVLPHRLQHQEAVGAVRPVRPLVLAHQALVDEGGEAVEGVEGDGLTGGGDGADGLQGAAPGEDGEAGEEALLLRLEQGVAPVQGVAQGLLAHGEVAGAAGEEGEALPGGVAQAGEQGLGRQQLDPGGGQLEGQGQPVQEAADLGDGDAVLRREGEVRARGPGALDEEAHRGAAADRGRVRLAGRLGEGQGRDGVLELGAEAQRGAAGDQDAQRRGGRQQVGDEGGGVEHLLEVVEHEQHPAPAAAPVRAAGLAPLGEHVGEGAGRIAGDGLAEVHGDGRGYVGGVGHRAEGDEPDAPREGGAQVGGHLQGEAGLARAARPGEGQ